MAYFALLWKARTIEKYRQKYESEKLKSIMLANTQIPKQSLSQRWRHYRYDTQKRISRTFRKWYPEGSSLSNFIYYLKTDQTFPNFVLKSVLGFFGGTILTYLCFMFFVFQLSISLIHATIMSSIIGVLLTLGLAFSYRIRCLVFLLIPQFFSRVGRYTLTCYALVLILTGPATNTLKNSEVLSESLACGQEQIKTSVNQINSLRTKPLNSLKDSIKLMIDRLRGVAVKVKQMTLKINSLVLNIAQVIQSGFLWLNSLTSTCIKKLGNPYENYTKFDKEAVFTELMDFFGANASEYEETKLNHGVVCVFIEHVNGDIVPIIKKRLRNYSDRIANMFSMRVHVHHSYSFSSNDSRSASQVAAGIVTEIRKRADPLITWLSWSSCVTSLFLLLIIFRAKYYQHMFETRSRFDNRYITKEIRDLDLKRLREGRETILPLNRRERAKYVTTTSFRLVASEKVYLNRSVVFMAITTFKLLIHMVADYSLYWVLMTIRYHGRMQSLIHPGHPTAGAHISGSGPTADLLKSLLVSFGVLLEFPASTPVSCLPNPHPPDFKRYTQIGVLIFLLWFFAMFEPYGLRLRHVVMGHYQPERAKVRADWLYTHILRTRGGFMKFARRKLHRTYKYRTEGSLTFRRWLNELIPSSCLRALLGTNPEERHCLLCGTTQYAAREDTELIRCRTSDCPGVYCTSCFADIGELCTICLSPKDYGDFSDVSLEKGSDGSEDDDEASHDFLSQSNRSCFSVSERRISDLSFSSKVVKYTRSIFSKTDKNISQDSMEPDLPSVSDNGMQNDPKDHNKAIIKKALLVRHMKNLMNDRRPIHERQYLVNCEYCNSEYCRNHHDCIRKIQDQKQKDINKRPQQGEITKNVDSLNPIAKDTKIKGKSLHSHRAKWFVKGKNKKYSKNDSSASKNNKSKHRTAKKSSNLAKSVLNVIAKSSTYSISLKGTNVNVEKVLQSNNNNKKSSRKNKSNAKEPPANDKKNAKKDKNNKKKSKKKNNDNAKKDTKENVSIKPPEISCRGLRKFRNLFTGFHKASKANKSLNCLGNGDAQNAAPSADIKKYKRRKKKKLKHTKSEDVYLKSDGNDSEDTRKYRISAYLAEQDWIKRQCKQDGDKINTKPEISEAVAVINSTSKNKSDKKLFHKEINLNIEPVVNKQLRGTFQSDDIIETSRNSKHLKNGMTFSDLWKTIGFRLLSDSSSSSFMEKIFRTTNKILTKESERNSSTDITRRLKFYESIGNDDFQKLEDFKDDIFWGMDSDQQKQSKTIIKAKKHTSNDGQIRTESPCSTCTEDFLLCFDKLFEDSHQSVCKKKFMEITRVVSDGIRSRYESSVTFIRSFCSNKKDIDKRDAITQSFRKQEDKNINTADPKKAGLDDSDSCDCLAPKVMSHGGPTVVLVASKTFEKDKDSAAKKKISIENAKTNTDKGSMATEKYPKPGTKTGSYERRKNHELKDKDSCPCIELKKVAPPVAVQQTNPINETAQRENQREKSSVKKSTTVIMRDRKTGSNTSVVKKSAHAEVQTERKAVKENFADDQEGSILKLKEDNHYVIADKVNKKTSASDEIKAIVKKSIEKLRSANKDIKNVLSKSLTKLTATEGLKTKSAKKVNQETNTESSKRTLKKSVNEEVMTSQRKSKTKVTDKRLEKDPMVAEGTQYICGCKSALEFLKRMQNQGMQTQPSKKDIKSNASKFKEIQRTPTKIIKSNEPDSSDTTDSNEKFVPKIITPTKRSKTSATSVKSNKAMMTKPDVVRTTSAKSVQSRVISPSKKPSGIKRSVNNIESEDCPCRCVCSEAREISAAKETCTCATQYVYYTDDSSSQMKLLKEFITARDENLQREIFEYTSSSCSGSDTILSSSIRSDPTVTDCTICSLAYIDGKPKKRKKRTKVSVVTKANQCTGTDRPRLCDVSTTTKDWWSPLIEKKTATKEITFDKNLKDPSVERKERKFTIGDQAMEMKKSKAVKTEGRIVTFRSHAQIIPTGAEDIMSPSRYLLESQWYYNELFSSKFYAPHLFPVSLVQKPANGSKTRSPTRIHHQSRRNRKAKRLDECYSPRKQISPRKQTGYEWIQSNEAKDRYQRKKLLRTVTRPNNTKKLKPSLKYEKMGVGGGDDKFQSVSNESVSLDVRCNSTSSFK
ncbi:uncharacterized protein LOC135083679 isoform X2 [Ostrinia nubilalis]|uniref:uncharacterized protein LOC135083679 isoform X2 n=1 Tax=Ostrinia nubilalis TaxID=29057 RepID=UPI0030826116